MVEKGDGAGSGLTEEDGTGEDEGGGGGAVEQPCIYCGETDGHLSDCPGLCGICGEWRDGADVCPHCGME